MVEVTNLAVKISKCIVWLFWIRLWPPHLATIIREENLLIFLRALHVFFTVIFLPKIQSIFALMFWRKNELKFVFFILVVFLLEDFDACIRFSVIYLSYNLEGVILDYSLQSFGSGDFTHYYPYYNHLLTIYNSFHHPMIYREYPRTLMLDPSFCGV